MTRQKLVLKIGQYLDLSSLVSQLLHFGYDRVEEIDRPGQYNLIGGNLLVFPTDQKCPTRLEFFGSEVESISFYDLKSGLKSRKVNSVTIRPNIIYLPDGSKLKPGDYIVHEDYGVGIFRTLGIREVGKTDREYIFLEYLNSDFLYVPVELSAKLSPYIGIGRRKPKLNKLGSQAWEKTYKKTYENILQLARELLDLYAVRSVKKRQPWQIDKHWDAKIVASFPYQDTVDQSKAVQDTYNDLQREMPMDRLILGDVGFGKTEVAIRASAQAVSNGFQVIILVPTTILVEQHYVTFKKRFTHLPVVVEHLSRFIREDKQKQIIDRVRSGQIDILIGTHRLLAEDISYKNLGLYIIDEEQRFGVKQKERIKKIRQEVNVLALSATPIPRTLFMSLAGIRDISQINTSPVGRLEIETEIIKENLDKVKKYIKREIGRGGQVYYLHNKVATIGGKLNQLKRLFPGLRIGAAHGQMNEERLANSMSRFASGEIQLLVCSTIIENGLDLPNANTLIVEDADKFGLAQLYQIRGRIGRSRQQAYALFMYSQREITGNATKRLMALAENTELGSGYAIALSDLEIRGGGNILGKEQHGNMESVGLVLYSRLLRMAVKSMHRV